ncbi:HAD-IA family hydrolase [Tyzzerella sp. OttesenSCG-928-J15]|nr:HAD-IA family hydrolase [Tyzzerella sp. OttesenSCG-928-J15]
MYKKLYKVRRGAKIDGVCGDLAKYFEQIISGDMFKETKPHPEIYLHTAKLLGSEPSNCLVIEDSTYGITAGHNAGMTVAAVIDERFSFDRTLADYQINSLSDIISLLDKLKFCTA